MYLVFDLECENHSYHKRKASPFDPRNYIVLVGWKHEQDTACSWTYWKEKSPDAVLGIPDDADTLIGFNIKYDLLWIWDTPELKHFLKRGGKIWCCQYAEYLLRAQHEKFHMCDLSTVSKLCGGTAKKDVVKEMWEAGYLTSQIPEDILIDYAVGSEKENRLGGDVGNTEIVYLNQIERAKKLGMYHAMLERMEGLLCTTEMEYNGLKIDMEEARSTLEQRTIELTELQEELNEYIPKFPEGAMDVTKPKPLEFSWTSDAHVSALIFGGAIKYRVLVPKVVSGHVQRKKIVEKWPLFQGQAVNPLSPGLELLDSGSYRWHRNLSVMSSLDSGSAPVRKHGPGNTPESTNQDLYLSGKKKGEPKFGNVTLETDPILVYEERIFDFPGFLDRAVVKKGKTPKGGWEANKLKDARGVPLMRVGEDSLDILGTYDVPFCKKLSRLSKLDKEIGTYYVRRKSSGEISGMLTCVEQGTRIIHHKLNHTSTVTSRLASSDPNLQNLPRAKSGQDGNRVKAMFVSRFGDDGLMFELDYNQLEVVGLQVLSGDVNLGRDLNNKVDFHCKRVSLKNKIPYEKAIDLCKNEDGPEYSKWHDERTKCKTFSFQKQYGAGVASMSRDTGIPEETIKAMIAAEEQEYPGVPKFEVSVREAIEKSSVMFRDPGRGLKVYRRGYWQAPTGTMYTWRSYDAPDFLRKKGIHDSFSPPEMKNYPIQGTSGEFVQSVLGRLFRLFLSTDNFQGKAFLVNTVHDCVWADVHKDVANEVAAKMKQVMESIPSILRDVYNIPCTVQFPVGVEAGRDMANLKHFEIEVNNER